MKSKDGQFLIFWSFLLARVGSSTAAASFFYIKKNLIRSILFLVCLLAQ
jgi:hypothetical protein